MTARSGIELRHGATIPPIGLGTWPMDDRECEQVVPVALDAGYRLIDTAENYRNETGIGRALRAGGVDRAELFVTSKFNRQWHGRDLVREALQGSLDRLGLDYLDLLLIHWPNPSADGYVGAWQGLIDLREAGLVRAIGTSNFKPSHLDRILAETGVGPDVNQIQLSPAVARPELRDYDAAHGIVTESWSPIGGSGTAVLREPVIRRLADELGRTPAQIVLRWHLQLGLVPLPKSADPQRLTENIDVFDFVLPPEAVAAISGLDQGESAAIDSDRFGH